MKAVRPWFKGHLHDNISHSHGELFFDMDIVAVASTLISKISTL